MKNFHDYLNDAQFYLHDQKEEYSEKEKQQFSGLQKVLTSKELLMRLLQKTVTGKGSLTQRCFYFVDFVKPTHSNLGFKPYLAIIKPELGTKAVLKLVVRYDTFRSFC